MQILIYSLENVSWIQKWNAIHEIKFSFTRIQCQYSLKWKTDFLYITKFYLGAVISLKRHQCQDLQFKKGI